MSVLKTRVEDIPTIEWIKTAPIRDVADFVLMLAGPDIYITQSATAHLVAFLSTAAVRLANEVNDASL